MHMISLFVIVIIFTVMSADDGSEVVMKGITHGACDYLIKPIRIEPLRNIFQHVVRKRKYEWKDVERISNAEDVEQNQKVPEDGGYSSSANEGHNWKNVKKRKDEDEDESEEREESSSKKPRVVWSVELHQQFVSAVNQLGIDSKKPSTQFYTVIFISTMKSLKSQLNW